MGSSGLFAAFGGNQLDELDSESRLRFETELRHAIEQAIPAGIAATDAAGRLLYVNPALCDMLGFSAEELLGKTPPLPHWPPEEADAIQKVLDGAVVGKMPEGGAELIFQRQSGERFWVLVRLSRVRLPATAGAHTVYVTSITDIDAQKKSAQAVRRSEHIYRAIGESINYGIWICDSEGRNIYASPAFLDLLGITQAECSEFGWGNTLHPDDAKATIDAWKSCVETGDSWEREHRFRGADGEWHWILARGVPIEDDQGKVSAWAGINLDIHASKEAEQAIRQSDQKKDEFIAVLAHELRNPLAPVRSSLELFQRSPTPETLKKALPVLQRQVKHMVRLVDDLLEITRIRRGTIELQIEPTRLEDVVDAAIDSVRDLAQKRHHSLRTSLPDCTVVLEVDPVRMTQALSNVLDNAIKYTPPGGEIILKAQVSGETLVLQVRDNGIGIPADQVDAIFEMFTQLDPAPGQARAGLGIGLNLVRSVVQLHGGEVKARSDGPGAGLEVEFRLRTTPERSSQRVEEEAPIQPPRSVLVVDDNRDAADMLSELLQALGHAVHTTYHGKDVLELLQRERFDLALIDLGMPEIDGLEVARRIKRTLGHRAPQLIAITGWGRNQDRARSRAAGFDAHLAKPVEVRDLLELMDELIPPREPERP